MEIMIKSSIKKRKFRIYGNNLEEIEYLSKKYGIPEERLIYQAILSPKVKDNYIEDLNALNEEINALLKEMFRLESEWAGLRYKAYLYNKGESRLCNLTVRRTGKKQEYEKYYENGERASGDQQSG